MNKSSNTQKALHGVAISSSKDLRSKLLKGIASLNRGEGIDGEQAFDRLRQRIKVRKSHS
jgi:hypothetical protein